MSKLPSRLVCIPATTGKRTGDKWLPVFPHSTSRVSLKTSMTKGVKEELEGTRKLVVIPPHRDGNNKLTAKVGMLAEIDSLRVNFDSEATTNLLEVSFTVKRAIRRVKIVSITQKNDEIYCSYTNFPETKMSQKQFESEKVQNLITELRDLVLRVARLTAPNMRVTKVDVKITREKMPEFLDTASGHLSLLAIGRGICLDELEDILNEPNFRTRLTMIVDAYKVALSKSEPSQPEDDYEVEELPDNVKKIIQEERDKQNSGMSAAESGDSRNYVRELLRTPWTKETPDNTDLVEAKRILDEDHFGLKRVKEALLGFLAIRKRQQDIPYEADEDSSAVSSGSILCLVGPPGTGKTSLGKSIARAMGREYVRLSLGGVRDEATIRGHRRTYVSAMPGRIITGMQRAGSTNPVFQLDEIDKLTSQFSGDPSAAMLEVLDPAQNSEFVDDYLNVPYDLSKVFFIATANTIDTIPGPLLDRMEVIHLPGYTPWEKLQILKGHIMSKVLGASRFSNSDIVIIEESLRLIVDGYTNDPGARGCEKKAIELLRKVAMELELVNLPLDEKPMRITPSIIAKYLGVPLPKTSVADLLTKETLKSGVGPILYVNSQGNGSVNAVEISIRSDHDGLGKKITGGAKEVIKDSFEVGVSIARANPDLVGGSASIFNSFLHVHFDSGAIQKDGPSAGVMLLCVLRSALIKKPIQHGFSATGEITLNRNVIFKVGGIAGKLVGARRAGLHLISIPADNIPYLVDVSEDFAQEIRVVLPDEDAREMLPEHIAKHAMEVVVRKGTFASWQEACRKYRDKDEFTVFCPRGVYDVLELAFPDDKSLPAIIKAIKESP